MSIEVRDARPGDGAALARIWRENAAYYVERFPEDFRLPDEEGLVEWNETLLARGREPRSLWLVAELEGTVAGYLLAHVQLPDESARWQMLPDRGRTRMYVDALGTAGALGRRGVATTLVEAAEEWGRGQGAEVVSAETYLESPVSVPFWERRMGYRRRSVTLTKPLR